MDLKLIETQVKYEAGHSYLERWIPTTYFCPGCGSREVWMRNDGGDYYVGEQYLCWRCGGDFYLPSGVQTNHASNWQTRQRLEAIRAAVSASEPQHE